MKNTHVKLQRPPGFGTGVAIDSPEVDEAAMAVTFPFADGRRRDGVGDLLEIGGIDTSRHQKNPVVLFDHGKQVALPIALAEDPATKAYTVVLDPVAKVATVKAYFLRGGSKNYDQAVFSEQVFDLMARRFIRAGSIGYQVVAARDLSPDYETGTPKGLHLLAVKMLEASAVVMPANQDTVMKMLAMPRICGRAPCEYLVKSLTPYAGGKKASVVSGFKTLNLSPVRLKYRPSYRRKTRHGRAGVGFISIREKELDKVRADCEGCGLKFTHFGGGKVKLVGDDSAIDRMAKQYGRPLSKGPGRGKLMARKAKGWSVLGKAGRKAMGEDEMLDDADSTVSGDPGPAEEMPPDADLNDDGVTTPEEVVKYGKQCLEKVRQDLEILLSDYDSMQGPLENEAVANFLTKCCENIAKMLDEADEITGSEYPSDDEDVIEEGAEDEVLEDEGAEELEEVETEPVGADSVRDDEDLPSEEEVLEGMDMIKRLSRTRTKSLKTKYKGKGKETSGWGGRYQGAYEWALDNDMDNAEEVAAAIAHGGGPKALALRKRYAQAKGLCPCGRVRGECQCGKKGMDEEVAETRYDLEETGRELDDVEDRLADHEVKAVSEAGGFLGELSSTMNFGDEHRMKSYHYFKTLDGIGSLAEANAELNQTPTGGDVPPATFDPGVGAKSLGGSRKMCKDAAGWFGELSRTRDFGDRHRKMCGQMAKSLEVIYGTKADPVEAAEAGGQAEHEEIGFEDVKSVKLLFDRQMEEAKRALGLIGELRLAAAR